MAEQSFTLTEIRLILNKFFSEEPMGIQMQKDRNAFLVSEKYSPMPIADELADYFVEHDISYAPREE